MSADVGSGYRLGVDVGGTFTDLLLIHEATGELYSAKVPSTPSDPSIGVLNGIDKICRQSGVRPEQIVHVMHGTTVATNAVLTNSGVRVGLVTTRGYRQVLQIARSFVPGGLGGWVIFNKRPPLAPLDLTIEADERVDARGDIVTPLDEDALVLALSGLKDRRIEALTVCLINSFANDIHEKRVRELAGSVLPGVPVSISSELIPEMAEYERTETTVVNSYIRPVVSRYLQNLSAELDKKSPDHQLHVLRSDGGLSALDSASAAPVNLLLSGPAGGVSGAQWVARQSGFRNLLTFDMGGTSTDVALIQDCVAQSRRETRVADVTVRISSVDVRTVGAGGGSIAYVPELTRALRVGPQSAGAEPGPAAYARGGDKPTVTDANVVLGYLPKALRLGGDMAIEPELAQKAIATIAPALEKSVRDTAEGIYDIVNENMLGALRLVSVEQGYDPRDFALIAFGGAGPLHANALGRLLGSWPVIIPPAPGVLCAYGAATTRLRDEASRTFIRRFDETTNDELGAMFDDLHAVARETLEAEGVAAGEQETGYQIDVRYRGQGTQLTIDISPDDLKKGGLPEIARRFDEQHTKLYTFALTLPHEVVTMRVIVQGPDPLVRPELIAKGNSDPGEARIGSTSIYFEGAECDATVFDRSRLRYGNRLSGPAIVMQADATTLILPGHQAEIDALGNILIRPNA